MDIIRIIVYGQVQCVGFRYHTLTIAQQIGVKGWVRNMVDGSVEIIAEGRTEQLEAFIPYIKEGPRFSRVDHIEIETVLEEKKYYDFTIK